MNKAVRNKIIFWDYNLDKMDLDKPEVKVWFLQRKLQFGDFTGIQKSDLKQYLPQLDIDSSLRELIENFLKQDV